MNLNIKDLFFCQPIYIINSTNNIVRIEINNQRISIHNFNTNEIIFQSSFNEELNGLNYLININSELKHNIKRKEFYEWMQQRGYDYKNEFQSINSIQYSFNNIYEGWGQCLLNKYEYFDVIIDGVFQVIVFLILQKRDQDKNLYVPYFIEKMRFDDTVLLDDNLIIKFNFNANLFNGNCCIKNNDGKLV